jgi:hypothetical protein
VCEARCAGICVFWEELLEDAIASGEEVEIGGDAHDDAEERLVSDW